MRLSANRRLDRAPSRRSCSVRCSNASFQGGVLRDDLLDGLPGDHLLNIAKLSHELTDALTLGEDLLLRPAQSILCVKCPLTPSRLNSLVFVPSFAVMTAAAVRDGIADEGSGFGVLIEER